MTAQLHTFKGIPPLRLTSQARQEYAGACPFCGGNHRSDRFRVWPEQNRYWCRQCNQSGWLDSIMGERGQQPLPQFKPANAQRHAAPTPNPTHIQHYRELYAEIALWAHANLLEECNPEPCAYLHKRGLSDATIGAALLGYALRDPNSLPDYLRKECPELITYGEAAGVLIQRNGKLQTHPNLLGTLVLPYMDGAQIVDLRTRSFPGKGYRSLPGGYMARGADRPFGWNETAKNNTILITEGEFKALAVTQAYHDGRLSAPAIAHPGLSYMHSEWPRLLTQREVRTVILAYDSQPRPQKDEHIHLAPEEIWSIRHGLNLEAAGLTVRVLRLPLTADADKADLDAFLLAHGPNALERLISGAPSLADYHASLPHTLLKTANLPEAQRYPRHRARPNRVEASGDSATGKLETTTSFAEARESIPQLVQQHATSGEGFQILAHPPGVGKGHGTTAGLQAWLTNSPNAGRIGWTGLRKNQHEDQHGLNLTPLHGRNEDNCQRLHEAHALASKGYPVREALCQRRCPFVSRCTYLRQFRDDNDHFASQQLLLATNWWKKNRVMVLDEFDPAQLTHRVTLTMSDLTAMYQATHEPHARDLLRWLSSLMIESGGCSLRGSTLLTALANIATREGQHLDRTLYAAKQALPSNKEHALLVGLPNGATLADYHALPPGHLPTLVRQLNHEAERMLGGQIFTSRLELRNGKITLFLRYEHLIAQLARPEQPKILLDASSIPHLLEAIFPNTPIQTIQPHIRIPGVVRQVLRSNWAKSTLHGERKTEWHDAVASYIRPEQPTLIVCTMEHEEELRTTLHARGHQNIVVAHYGALRGSNSYKGYDVILAQVYHPNLDAIIYEGRALFADDPTALDERIIIAERTLQDNDGSYWEVQVPTFADARLAALLERHREAEMVQCALRGRPFDHPESQITLMFSLPLPGLTPTTIIPPEVGPTSSSGRKAASLHKLIRAGQHLCAAGQTRLSVDDLAQAAEVSVVTVRTHWKELAHALTMETSTETIRPPGKRSYKRAILVMPHAEDSASESPMSRDQADNKSPIICLISAHGTDQADVISAEPDPLPLPDREPELIATPEQYEACVPTPQPSYSAIPHIQRDRGASITQLLHPQRSQPPPDRLESAHRRGRDAVESSGAREILRMFGNEPRPP
ncbi:hypothetical protein [Candidatus Oscillochloris fontis]|uniref:hypothetical protein n=1 Tax=Candidatus Oscillochloris fontis TaxID=2496868 RepID=UPI00101BC128|nr:hypothetical protein [Candidatus Oscillochloris fontis]